MQEITIAPRTIKEGTFISPTYRVPNKTTGALEFSVVLDAAKMLDPTTRFGLFLEVQKSPSEWFRKIGIRFTGNPAIEDTSVLPSFGVPDASLYQTKTIRLVLELQSQLDVGLIVRRFDV